MVRAIDASPVDDRVSPGSMSPRDRAHWHEVQDWRTRSFPEPVEPSTFSRVLGAGSRLLPWLLTGVHDAIHGTVESAVGTAVEAVAGTVLCSVAHRIAGSALGITDRLGEVGVRLGRVGLGPDDVIEGLRRAGHDVATLADVADLEVDDVLAARPARTRAYIAVSALHGGTTALLVGAGSHGAGIAGLAAPAVGGPTDTVLTVAVCTRAIAHVGAWYGYDTTDPVEGGRERAVALAVLAVALAPTDERRAADAVARAVADGQAPPPRLARDVTDRLRGRRHLRDVARVVPALGAGLGAVASARLLCRVAEDADHLYRERFLREKYRAPAPVAAGPALVA